MNSAITELSARQGCVRRLLKGRASTRRLLVSWIPAAMLPFVALALFGRSDGWLLMWALSVAIFFSCKSLTWCDAVRKFAKVPRWMSAGYLFAWVGMDAAAFFDTRRPALESRPREWLMASGKTVLGCLLVWGVAPLLSGQETITVWVALIGLCLLLHFGIFHLLSLGWRRAGVNAQPIMRAPLAARSISEFWNVRWNRAFHALAERYVFKPACRRLGTRGALMATFLVSGIIHDLVISIPARGGYGLPTCYFLIQGLAVMVERSSIGHALGVRGGGRGWLFMAATTVLPIGLLFHRRFMEWVIAPFLQIIHAL